MSSLIERLRGVSLADEDDDLFPLCADAAARIEALEVCLKKAVAAMEAYEVKVDGEWGNCRKIEEIEADGDLPDEIVGARALLAQGA